jgi:hypothetical protein
MTSDPICCQRLSKGPSPFEVSMLGWYDGVTSGVAKCRACGRTYHFEMLAWDDEQEMRVYAFKEVTKATYDAIVLLLDAPPPTPERAAEFGDVVALRVRDALITNPERNLLVLAANLATFIESARVADFAQWKELIGTG